MRRENETPNSRVIKCRTKKLIKTEKVTKHTIRNMQICKAE